MKKVKYLAMLLAAGMFAACSDNLEDTGAGNAGGTTPGTGEGYVKVAINLPTTNGSMSRVDDNNIFDDGVSNEYAVNNGIIAFYSGATAESATFVRAYNLGDLTQMNQSPENDQVTTRVAIIQEAPLVTDEANHMYALVILNPNNIVTVSNNALSVDEQPVTGTIKNLQETIEIKEENNIKAFTETTIGEETKPSFLMTNAPLSNKTSGNNLPLTGQEATVDVQTLVQVDVHETREEAIAPDVQPNEIYVERIVAKVTLTGFDSNKQIKVTNAGSDFDGDIVTLSGWALNVTNNYTYLVRNVNDIDTWGTYTIDNNPGRFIGNDPVNGSTATDKLYRIYWGIDPNYSSVKNDAFTTYGKGDEENITWETDIERNDNPVPLYCLENTFDVTNQTQDKTTTLLIQAKYDMTPNDETAESFFVVESIAQTYNEEDFINYIKGKVTSLSEANLSINPEAKGGFYNKEGGSKKLSTLLLKDGAAITGTDADELNKLDQISYYKDGETYYYAARIQHFGNDTPWTSGSYVEAKHLGRYGVLRNNWYEINIESISGPGKPEMEDPGSGGDDEDEGYIRAEINVLSWAKRSQDVNL